MRTSDSSCPRRFRRITLLLHQFGFDNNRGQIHGWPWYQAAVLLGAIGLGAPFAEAKQSVAAALGLGLAPTLVFCFEAVYLHPAESMCRLFWFWFFVQSSGSAYRECHQPTPHSVHASSCGPSRRAGALIIALFLPKLTNLRNQRLETKIVPGLLKQIYEAEMIYSATAGRELRMRWHSAGGIRGKLDWKAAANTSLKKYFRIDYYYNISLDCADEAKPRSFRVNAVSNQGYILDPHISIDETGCSQICLGVLSPREMVTSIPL